MDNSEKDMYSYVMQHKIGINQSFNFGCDGCGNCCKNREDILLSGWDLFKIAKYMNKSNTLEVISEFAEVYIGNTSKLPVCRLKPIGEEKKCPFLEGDGKCRIHPVKPSVCGLYPLGRMYNFKKDHVIYFLQEVKCGFKDQIHKVRDWLSVFNMTEEYNRFKKRMNLEKEALRFVEAKKYEKIVQTKYVSDLIFLILYSYSTDLDFDEQFKEHTNDFKKVVRSADKCFK